MKWDKNIKQIGTNKRNFREFFLLDSNSSWSSFSFLLSVDFYARLCFILFLRIFRRLNTRPIVEWNSNNMVYDFFFSCQPFFLSVCSFVIYSKMVRFVAQVTSITKTHAFAFTFTFTTNFCSVCAFAKTRILVLYFGRHVTDMHIEWPMLCSCAIWIWKYGNKVE